MKTLTQLWNPPTTDLSLANSEVHVWWVCLDQQMTRIQSLAQTLSPDERRRAEGYRFKQDRKRFIIRRGLLRTLLSHYLGAEPGQLKLRYGPCGKPSITEPLDGSALCFSTSHSNGLDLYAFTWGRELGVDIEYIRPIPEVERLAAFVFSDREIARLRELSQELKLQSFFSCWTRKEAYTKATGYGLTQELKDFSVSLTPGESARLLSDNGGANACRWSLVELTVAPGYVAALCVEGHDWHLVLREYS